MKKSFLSIFIILFIILFAGCKDKKINNNENIININENNVLNDDINTIDENDLKKLQLTANIPCVLFYDSAYIWTLNDNGTLDPVTQLYNGSELLAFPSDSEKIGEELETKEFHRTGKTESEMYTKILYNNKICWINSFVISPYSIPGIVIDPLAVVYKNPDILEVDNDVIPQFQIVAINTNFISPKDSDISFSKVTFRSEDKSYRNVYVKTDVLSDFKDDIVAMKLLNKAAISEDRLVKEELLKNCNQLTLSEIMKNKVEEDTENILYQYIPEE